MLAGSALVPFRLAWVVPGTNPVVSKKLALNTCSGCHRSETGTLFLHVMAAETRARFDHLPPITTRTEVTLSAFLKNELATARTNDFSTLLITDADSLEYGPGTDHGNGKVPKPPKAKSVVVP